MNTFCIEDDIYPKGLYMYNFGIGLILFRFSFKTMQMYSIEERILFLLT